MCGNTVRNYCKTLRIHGNTSSFSQIFGRKPRYKSYTADDLKIFVEILFTFPRLTQQSMRYQLYLGTRKIFKRNTVRRMLAAVLYSYKKITVVKCVSCLIDCF